MADYIPLRLTSFLDNTRLLLDGLLDGENISAFFLTFFSIERGCSIASNRYLCDCNLCVEKLQQIQLFETKTDGARSDSRLNLLGQVAGVASTEFGLAGMIFSAVTIATDGDFVATQGQTVGLFIGLLVVHGLLNVRMTTYLLECIG